MFTCLTLPLRSLPLVLGLGLLAACADDSTTVPADVVPNNLENTATLCSDGVDNDGDQRLDCADQDCSETPPCQSVPDPEPDAGGRADTGSSNDAGPARDTGVEADAAPGPVDEDCFAPGDEDGDGRADCDDRDCESSPACVEPFELDCGNGLDDDFDGRRDCDDPDCEFDLVCRVPTPEECGDGLDNDLNGLADCDDPVCAEDTACLAVCLSDAMCLSSDACFDGICRPALPNLYILYAGIAEFAARDEAGETWDAFGGAPDPVVEFAIDGVLLDGAVVCDDSFRCDFTAIQYPLNLDLGTTIEVFLSDDDVASDDIVAYCTVAVTAELVRQGYFRCAEGTTAGVDVFIGR